MTITTLLFDIGDVLIDIDWQRGYRKMLGYLKHEDGRDLALEEITEALKPGAYGDLWVDFDGGAVAEETLLDIVTKKTGYGGERTRLKASLSELFEPLPHRIDLLNDLIVNKHLTVALVSDTNSLHMNHIENYIPTIFKNVPKERRFYSHNTGLKKKNGKEIYEHVVKTLCVDPKNAVMIDDRLQNKPGADAIGLNFLHVEKHQDLGALLKNIL